MRWRIGNSGKAAKGKNRVNIIKDKVCVLKENQDSEISGNAEAKDFFLSPPLSLLSIKQQAENIIQPYGCQHNQHIQLLTPGIKKQARQQQDSITEKTTGQIIESKGEWKKEKKKNY